MDTKTALNHLLEVGINFLENPASDERWNAFLTAFETMRLQGNEQADSLPGSSQSNSEDC